MAKKPTKPARKKEAARKPAPKKAAAKKTAVVATRNPISARRSLALFMGKEEEPKPTRKRIADDVVVPDTSTPPRRTVLPPETPASVTTKALTTDPESMVFPHDNLEPGSNRCHICIGGWVDAAEAIAWASDYMPWFETPILLHFERRRKDGGVFTLTINNRVKGEAMPDRALNAPWHALQQRQLAENRKRSGDLKTFPLADQKKANRDAPVVVQEAGTSEPPPQPPKPATIVESTHPRRRRLGEDWSDDERVVTAKKPAVLARERERAEVAKTIKTRVVTLPSRKNMGGSGVTSKSDQVVELLKREEGCTPVESTAVTDWPSGEAYFKRMALRAKMDLIQLKSGSFKLVAKGAE